MILPQDEEELQEALLHSMVGSVLQKTVCNDNLHAKIKMKEIIKLLK